MIKQHEITTQKRSIQNQNSPEPQEIQQKLDTQWQTKRKGDTTRQNATSQEMEKIQKRSHMAKVRTTLYMMMARNY